MKTKKMIGVWPTAWLEEYDHLRFSHVDQIFHSCRNSKHAFRWSDITITHGGARRVMTIAEADYRMQDGYCIPYFGLNGYQGGISFGGMDIDRSVERDLALEVVAVFAFHRISAIKAEAPKLRLLTARQREVMQWVAAGKTAWDIASILRVSEETVRTTIKAAMGRLGVHTRAQAVAAALRSGEISS